MLSAACIATAVMILAGVRHEPRLRAWALNPRTPHRIAASVTSGLRATGTAVASAVLIAGGATILAVALVGAMNQAAGAL